eukprot:jgi/Chlat1/1718/Chrsp129S01964
MCTSSGGALPCTCTASHGDPHLTGFQGQRFDFQGVRGLPQSNYAFLYDPTSRIWVGVTLVSRPLQQAADGSPLWVTVIQAIGVSVPAAAAIGNNSAGTFKRDHHIIIRVGATASAAEGHDSLLVAEFEDGTRIDSSVKTADYELIRLEDKVVAIKFVNIAFSVVASLAARRTSPYLNLGFQGPGLSQHTHGVMGQTVHTWYNASGSEEYGHAYGPNGHFSGKPSDYMIKHLFDVDSFEQHLPELELEESVKNKYVAKDKYAGVAHHPADVDANKEGARDDE